MGAHRIRACTWLDLTLSLSLSLPPCRLFSWAAQYFDIHSNNDDNTNEADLSTDMCS